LIVSSAEVYGTPKGLPVTEESAMAPGSPYAESRVEQEKIALASGKDVVIVRSFNHSGPGQPGKFVLPYLAKQLAEVKAFKRDTILLGNPHVQRDFSDVRDIVKAYVLALEKGESKEVYNLCSGRAYHLGKLAVKVAKEIGRDIQVLKDPEWDRPHDILELYGSYKKFNTVTGWKPEIDIVKTLLDMVDSC
jgi:GDP-4-dehydro-6-deoxy-D-mannose reductase